MKEKFVENKSSLSDGEVVKKIQGMMLFTYFGNTEYVGRVYFDNDRGGLYFMTEKEGMIKPISIQEARKILKDDQSKDFFK